jgi:L-lysine exporter family protein LysE/ArgO
MSQTVLAPFAAGFALGLSLILAIGAQNAFVLRQGLRREHVGAVVAVCALSDAALIASGSRASARWPRRCRGWRRRCAGGGAALAPGAGAPRALWPVVATALALTWLNPHVYLDTVVLLGSVAAGWGEARPAFAAGAMTASLLFFSALGYGARLLAPVFARPDAWRGLEAGIGAVMGALALGLALGA